MLVLSPGFHTPTRDLTTRRTHRTRGNSWILIISWIDKHCPHHEQKAHAQIYIVVDNLVNGMAVCRRRLFLARNRNQLSVQKQQKKIKRFDKKRNFRSKFKIDIDSVSASKLQRPKIAFKRFSISIYFASPIRGPVRDCNHSSTGVRCLSSSCLRSTVSWGWFRHLGVGPFINTSFRTINACAKLLFGA